jgi:hypothetical protein
VQALHKLFVCYKLKFMLIYANPRAERAEPSTRPARYRSRSRRDRAKTFSARPNRDRDQASCCSPRPSRTELLNPRDETEQGFCSACSACLQAWLSGPLPVVPVLLVPMPACRSAFFSFVEHNSLFGPLVPVPVPLAPVPACECVEQTS